MRRPGVAALLLAVAGQALAAGEPTVRATVDAAKVGENEAVHFTVEISGTDLPGMDEPDLGGLTDFTIASGPSTSTATSMVWRGGGAEVTSSRKYGYALLPKRLGTLSIPPVTVKIGGRTYRTRELQVEVVKGSARRQGGAVQGSDPMASLFGRRPAEPEIPEGEIFIDVQLDRESAYVGQQVLLTYRIYTQTSLAALPQPQELPSLNGFWVEEIPVDPRATIRTKVIRGKEYTEITLAKKALFPTRSGSLTIEETVYQVPVSVRSRDPFDRLLNPSRTVYRRAASRTLDVLPLPEEGRPEAFRGAVGRFSMDVTADRHEAGVNDAVGVKVEVSGDGNLRTLSPPVVGEDPDYRRFDPKVTESRSVEDDRIQGSRQWEYVFVPLAPGEKAIPPIRFAYFDPVVAKYREIESPKFVISVARGAAVAGGGQPGGARREVIAMREDIRYIKPSSDLGAGGRPFHRSPLFYALLLLPVVGNAVLWAHMRRREHLQSNVHLFRRRRATREARRRLKRAEALLAGKAEAESVFDELERALSGYIADKFNVSASGLTHERISELLDHGRVARPLRERALACLEKCDAGRFAPGENGRERLEDLVARSREVIAGLERGLS